MNWTSPPQLVVLAAFYERARAAPDTISDAQLLAAVRDAHWPTNCWSYVEASFAIIAPACKLRPHLTAALIAMPIAAMIAGGLDTAELVIAHGQRCAAKRQPYVAPAAGAADWLSHTWPTLGALVEQVFEQQWQAAMLEDDD